MHSSSVSACSILIVPVLVHLASQPDKVAIAESLAILGVIAAIGAVPYVRQNPVDWHSVRYFRVREDQGAYNFQQPPQIRDRPRRRMTIDKRRLSSIRNGPGPIDQFAESETSTSDFGSSAKPGV